MEEAEKVRLYKQKKLLDCLNDLNFALKAFEGFEEHSSQLLSVIDGFDLTDGDTYLKLTLHVRQELSSIKFFARSAAENLVGYRQLCNSESKISTLQEKKIRTQDDSQFASKKLNLLSGKPKSKKTKQSQIPKIEEIEFRLTRLEWSFFFLLWLQITILIRLFQI